MAGDVGILGITEKFLAEDERLPEREIETIKKELGARIEKLRERYTPLLPGQTLGISADAALLTSALFFDRVWFTRPTNHSLLQEIAFFGATEQEAAIYVLYSLEKEGIISSGARDNIITRYEQFTKHVPKSHPTLCSTIANILAAERGVVGVPIFSSHVSRDREYQPGDTGALTALIRDLQVIDEDQLSIPQVLEFRQDKVSLQNLRRFRHWLDSELIGKPLTFVQDEIAVRLERYESALKKHGVVTVTGIISDLLDEKFVLGLSGAVASIGVTADPFWAGIAGTALTVGRATLSVSRRLVDLKDRTSIQGAEVAFVHEAAKLTR